MLGFYAEGLTEEITIDPGELRDARWFTRDELLAPEANGFSLPRADSIARRLIEDWLAAGGGVCRRESGCFGAARADAPGWMRADRQFAAGGVRPAILL